MNKIPTQQDNPNGLHQRYYIQKVVPTAEQDFFGQTKYATIPTDEGAEYFVMRLDEGGKDRKHIAACRVGINAYADAVQDHLPELAKDLKERYPLLTPSNG